MAPPGSYGPVDRAEQNFKVYKHLRDLILIRILAYEVSIVNFTF